MSSHWAPENPSTPSTKKQTNQKKPKNTRHRYLCNGSTQNFRISFTDLSSDSIHIHNRIPKAQVFESKHSFTTSHRIDERFSATHAPESISQTSTGIIWWRWNDTADFRPSSIHFLSSAVRSNVLHKQWRTAKATQCPRFCRDSARVMLSGRGRGRNEGSGRVSLYAWEHATAHTPCFLACDARPYIKDAIHCRDHHTETFPIWYGSNVTFRTPCLGLDSVCKSPVWSAG